MVVLGGGAVSYERGTPVDSATGFHGLDSVHFLCVTRQIVRGLRGLGANTQKNSEIESEIGPRDGFHGSNPVAGSHGLGSVKGVHRLDYAVGG